MNRIALPVRQHLNFDVARPLQEFLHVDNRRAEGGLGLGLRHLYGGEQYLFVVHHPHTATTAAGCRLHNHGETNFSRDPNDFVRVIGQCAVRARYRRNTGALHLLLGRYLVTHQADGVGGRANKGEAALLYLLGKVSVL